MTVVVTVLLVTVRCEMMRFETDEFLESLADPSRWMESEKYLDAGPMVERSGWVRVTT